MISIIVLLLIVGVALYLIDLVPMDATVKRVIQVLAILCVILYALEALGLWHGFQGVTLR